MRAGTQDVATISSGDTEPRGGAPGHRPATKRRLARPERRLALLLACAPLLGAFGVVAAELVPDERIADRLLEARATGVLLDTSGVEPSPLGTAPARYTECTGWSLGLGDRAGDGVVATALASPAFTGCGRLAERLDDYRRTGSFDPGFPYVRYWHGYSVITRPAVALTGVSGTRWITYALAATVVGATAVAVRRLWGLAVAAVLVTPALLTTDLVIAGLSATTALGGACAWLGGWLVLRTTEARPTFWAAALAAGLAGAVTAYFDLMTTLPGALALASCGAAMGGAAAGGGAQRFRAWRLGAAATVGWVIGLSWMWASKWVIAAAVLGVEDVSETVRTQIAFRVSSGASGTSSSRTDGLTRNLRMWWEQALTPAIVLGVLSAIVAVALVGAMRHAKRRVPWSLVLFALVTFGVTLTWYVALDNHSQIHPQLVYRSLPVSFGAALALVLVALRAGPAEPVGPNGIAGPDNTYGGDGERPA